MIEIKYVSISKKTPLKQKALYKYYPIINHTNYIHSIIIILYYSIIELHSIAIHRQ